MARYIDAEPMLREAIEERKFVFAMEDARRKEIIVRTVYKDLAEFIDNQPTADVAEVVRCCDCKHIAIINNSKLYAKCEKTNYEFNPFETDTRSHFCSYGERRAEE